MINKKGRFIKNTPLSSMGYYQTRDPLSGWEQSDALKEQDIFKQLKVNLNQYELKYSQFKKNEMERASSYLHPLQKSLQQKENEDRLPTIVHSTPLKRMTTNKEIFAVRNRNILEDAINYSDQHAPKIFKISKIFKMRNNLIFQEAEQTRKSHMQNRDSKIRNTNIKKSLVDYDFSDTRLHLHYYAHKRQKRRDREEIISK